MAKVVIPISNGFEEIETCTIIDVLRRAQIEVKIASIEEPLVKGAHDITIKADCLIDEINENNFDMIILPGGLPNAFNLADNLTIQQLLKDFKEKEKNIGAICAAPYALYKAEVLNTNYTCYPSFEQKIKKEGYHENDDIVIDGKIITSRGPATAMNFALEIITILISEEKSQEIKAQLLAK